MVRTEGKTFDAAQILKVSTAMAFVEVDGDPVDEVTVVNKMKKLGTLDEAGGPLHVAELVTLIREPHERIEIERNGGQ